MIVLPNRRVVSWQQEGDDTGLFPAKTTREDVSRALLTPYKTDAHAQLLAFEGRDQSPRLALHTLPFLNGKLTQGQQVVTTSAMVDIDRSDKTPWSSWSEAAAHAKKVSGMLGNAWVLPTGKGLRVIWYLPGIPAHQARRPLENVVAYVKEKVGARLKDLGLEVDDDCPPTPTRIYRLPLALRTDVELSGHQWRDPRAFAALLKGLLPDVPPEVDVVPDATKTTDTLVFTRLDTVSQAADITEGERLKLLQGTITGQPIHPRLLAGTALATPGARNNTIFGAAGDVVENLLHLKRFNPGALPAQWSLGELALAVLKPCILADKSNGAPTLDQAARMVTYHLQDAGVEDLAPTPSRQSTPYGPPYILQIGASSYYYARLDSAQPNEWTGPFSVQAVARELHREQPNIPNLLSQRGVPRSAPTLPISYVRSVGTLIYSSVEPGWDLTTDCLRVRPKWCTLSDPEPEYNEQVDTWLRYLGGSRYEKLERWIASFPRIDRPTAALAFIQASDGVGKQLLVTMLSAWFGGSTPTRWQSLTGQYNGKLLDCPVIWMDEVGRITEKESQLFRDLTGNKSFTINPKFQPMSQLESCLRVVATSNESNALQVRDASVSYEASKAVSKRILQINPDPQTADYLNSLGGYVTTGDWIREDGGPGKAVRHMAWLVERYALDTFPGRWLVGPDDSEVMQTMIAGNRMAFAILWALAARFERGAYDQRYIRYRKDKGGLVFNVADFLKTYHTYANPSYRNIPPDDLTRGIRQMSAIKEKGWLRMEGDVWGTLWLDTFQSLMGVLPIQAPGLTHYMNTGEYDKGKMLMSTFSAPVH